MLALGSSPRWKETLDLPFVPPLGTRAAYACYCSPFSYSICRPYRPVRSSRDPYVVSLFFLLLTRSGDFSPASLLQVTDSLNLALFSETVVAAPRQRGDEAESGGDRGPAYTADNSVQKFRWFLRVGLDDFGRAWTMERVLERAMETFARVVRWNHLKFKLGSETSRGTRRERNVHRCRVLGSRPRGPKAAKTAANGDSTYSCLVCLPRTLSSRGMLGLKDRERFHLSL